MGLSHTRILRNIVIGALVLCMCCVWLWKIFEYRFYLSQLPKELGVWHITHLTTATYGFGPGGESRGFVLFALPQSTADEILELGTGWFEQLAPFDRSFDRLEWATTPFSPEEVHWTTQKGCDLSDWWTEAGAGHVCPGIAAFVRGFGFLYDLDPDVTAFVDQSVFSEGAYVLEGRSRLILVDPKRRYVVYAYH